MRQRTHRLRRVGAAALLGMGMTAGVIGVTAGVAAAATVGAVTESGTVVTIFSTTASAQALTGETVTIPLGTAATTTSTTFTATLSASGGGTAVWTAATVVEKSGTSFGTTTAVTSAPTGSAGLVITTPALSTSTAKELVISAATLTTTNAQGTISAAVTTNTSDTWSTSSVLVANTKHHTATLTASTNPTIPATVGSDSAGALPVSIPATWNLQAATTYVLHLAVASTTGATTWGKSTTTASATNVTLAASALKGQGTATLAITFHPAANGDVVSFTVDPAFGTTAAGGNLTVTATLKSTSGVAEVGDAFAATAVPAHVLTAATKKADISRSSAPSVTSSGLNKSAGNLQVTLVTTQAAATKLTLHVASATGTDVKWTANPTISSSGVATNPSVETGVGTATLVVIVTTTAAKNATITFTNIHYTTSGAHGTITVTPMLQTAVRASATTTEATFSPVSVVNATAPGKSVSAAATHTLAAKTTPYVGRGASGAAAGSWTLHLAGTKATVEGWTKTTTITIKVAPNSGTNCSSSKVYVLVTGTPTATVGTTKTVSTTPTVKVTADATGITCTVSDHNVVSLTFTNSGTFTGATGSFHIVVGGVKYNVGSTTATGNVAVSGAFTTTGTAFTVHTSSTTGATATTPANSGPSNADVVKLYVTANTPAVTLSAKAFDAGISPVNVVEAQPGQVSVGYVCVSLATGNVFNTTASATAKVTKGTGTVTSTVSYETSAGTKATTAATAFYARFKVTKASATTASTYALSGLKVNASASVGSVTTTVKHVGSATNCHATGTTIGTAIAYSIKATAPTQIYGATSDATAVKELETTFPGTGGATCVGGHPTVTANRPVILATDQHFQDALASQYLASDLNTGTLLTPYGALSTVTLNALKTEGVTQVYVVGGPLAVSATVVNQLMTTPAYHCGGTSLLKTGKTQEYIHVTRIWGQTQYDTAQRIAEFVSASHVGTAAFPEAYLGVNTTKGNGKYNDTAGIGSPAPSSAATLKTAILASGVEFQDAEAASALSYATDFPILLTSPTSLSSQASAAIATLKIRQVIVMGGQLAVTNTVVTSLEGLGVSVLRVAGQSYTDTAVQLAKFEENTGTLGRGWSNGSGVVHTVAVARGNGFTDGLTGAVIAGTNKYPQLLTESPTAVGKYLTAFLKASGTSGTGINTNNGKTGKPTSKITTLTIFGGPLAVSPAVVSQMVTDIS